VWASKSLVDLIKQRQEVTEGSPQAAFVVSRQIVNTKIGKEVREVLEEYGLKILTNGTFQRITYAETAAEGLTVFEGYDDLAKCEVAAIADEIHEQFFKGAGLGGYLTANGNMARAIK
jgi:chromosome partitioning protein